MQPCAERRLRLRNRTGLVCWRAKTELRHRLHSCGQVTARRNNQADARLKTRARAAEPPAYIIGADPYVVASFGFTATSTKRAVAVMQVSDKPVSTTRHASVFML